MKGRLILTAEVAKNKVAKTTKIYYKKFARYFSLPLSSESEPKKSENIKGSLQIEV